MLRQQKIDAVVMGALSVIGLGCMVLSSKALTNVDVKCSVGILRNGWIAIQVLGGCLLTVGFAYFMCSWSYSCYSEQNALRTSEFFLGLFLILGLFLTGIASGIYAEYTKLDDPSDIVACDNSGTGINKQYATMVMAVGGLVVLVSGGLLAKEVYASLNTV